MMCVHACCIRAKMYCQNKKMSIGRVRAIVHKLKCNRVYTIVLALLLSAILSDKQDKEDKRINFNSPSLMIPLV